MNKVKFVKLDVNSNLEFFSVGKDGAYMDEDGVCYWFKNERLHRDDGPAYIEPTYDNTSFEVKEWFFNGRRHRVGGPAIIDSSGNQSWFQNGRFHREDGPAFISSDGTEVIYYLYGEEISYEKFILDKELRSSLKNKRIKV